MVSLSPFDMSFFRIKVHGAVAVAVIERSRLTEEENLEEFHRELTAIVDQFQMTSVVLNFHDVEFLTSQAVGKLISFHRRLHRQQGRLVLCELQGGVVDVLRATRLTEYFSIAATQDDALALFK